jgi:hypothetical protein
MKLEDLFAPPDLIELLETLNYNPLDLVWNNDEGTFSVNDHKFVVNIRPATSTENQSYSSFLNPVPLIGNLEFSAILDDYSKTQDTTNKAKSGVFKVFGGVAYVAEQLIKKYNYKIVLCIAKKKASPTNFSGRTEAYRNIIPRISKNIDWSSMELISNENETIFVIYHPSYSDGIQKIKNYLIQYYSN